MRVHATAALLAILLGACAPVPVIAPAATGKGASEVSRLVAASEAKQFPCNIGGVKGVGDTAAVESAPGRASEVTLLPGRYQVTLSCSSGFHEFKPETEVVARAGKVYTLTGYLIDDSITIFNMKMRIKVAEK